MKNSLGLHISVTLLCVGLFNVLLANFDSKGHESKFETVIASKAADEAVAKVELYSSSVGKIMLNGSPVSFNLNTKGKKAAIGSKAITSKAITSFEIKKQLPLYISMMTPQKRSFSWKLGFKDGRLAESGTPNHANKLTIETWPNLYKIFLDPEPVKETEAVKGSVLIGTKRIDFDSDGSEEQIRLVQTAGSKVYLEVRHRKPMLTRRQEVTEAVGAETEIQDIADINGDGNLEFVIEGKNKAGEFLEIFSLTSAGLRRVFADDGLVAWEINGKGQEIIIQVNLQDTVHHQLTKHYIWRDKCYLLAKQNASISGNAISPQNKMETAKAYLEALSLGEREEADSYLNRSVLDPSQAKKVIKGSWIKLTNIAHRGNGQLAVGALYPTDTLNYYEGKVYLFSFSRKPAEKKGWQIDKITVEK